MQFYQCVRPKNFYLNIYDTHPAVLRKFYYFSTIIK
jgi:hypothetical protein